MIEDDLKEIQNALKNLEATPTYTVDFYFDGSLIRSVELKFIPYIGLKIHLWHKGLGYSAKQTQTFTVQHVSMEIDEYYSPQWGPSLIQATLI